MIITEEAKKYIKGLFNSNINGIIININTSCCVIGEDIKIAFADVKNPTEVIDGINIKYDLFDKKYLENLIIDYKNNHDEIELNGILLEIDQSESESSERLKGIITEIAMSDNFVPFKEETIKACGEIIVEEKERLRYKQSIEKKSDEKDTSAASLAEYAKKRRETLSKK